MVAEITFPAGIVIGRKLDEDPANPEYRGGNHTARERARFWALIEEVGFQRAIEICDYFIPWRKGIRPPPHILMEWVWDHFDGKGEIDDKARNFIQRLAPKYAANKHLRVIDVASDTLVKMITRVHELLESGQPLPAGYPSTLGQLYNNTNYAIQYGGHGGQSAKQTMSFGGGLTIVQGDSPRRKRLRDPKMPPMLDVTARTIPDGDG